MLLLILIRGQRPKNDSVVIGLCSLASFRNYLLLLNVLQLRFINATINDLL